MVHHVSKLVGVCRSVLEPHFSNAIIPKLFLSIRLDMKQNTLRNMFKSTAKKKGPQPIENDEATSTESAIDLDKPPTAQATAENIVLTVPEKFTRLLPGEDVSVEDLVYRC